MKQKENKKMLKPIIILTIIVIFSVSLLLLINSLVSPMIGSQKSVLKDEKAKAVFPEADSFTERGDILEVYDGSMLVGFIAEGSAYGYSSDIQFIVGINPDLTIRSVSVLSQAETPGLGSKIQSDEFLGQFVGKTINQLALREAGGEIDAVTGATVSSKALTQGIKKSISEIDG